MLVTCKRQSKARAVQRVILQLALIIKITDVEPIPSSKLKEVITSYY